MNIEKINLAAKITASLANDEELRTYTLQMLLSNNTVSIAEIVKLKEDAMNETLMKNKEDLSTASALLARHIDKINTKHLKEDSEKFIKEQGFLKC